MLRRLATQKPMSHTQEQGEVRPRIVRGRVGSLSLYEITDYELDVLAAGSPNSVYLNFAVFFLSIGLSFIASLFSATFQTERRFTAFLVVSVVGIALGVLLLVVWSQAKSRVDDVLKRIRERAPGSTNSPTEAEAL
jgi:hypothetical protein